jgi:hypothetical protein
VESLVNEDEIRVEYRDLAVSLFGCDGGNICARLWVCGIEWGGDLQELLDYSNTRYDFQIQKERTIQIPYRAEGNVSEGGKKSPYDKRLSGLCLRAFHHWQPEREPEALVASRRQLYLEKRLYNRDSDIFKLNLYAYPCRSTSTWNNDATRLTGCKTKRDFRRRCEEERFPVLLKLLKANKPKVLLCTGTSCRLEFLMAFTGQAEENLQPLKRIQHELEIYETSTPRL